MGDILGEWLNSTILREISDGLQWLESGSIDSANKKRHFEDDGNTLKAKISKPGNVQVTKFVTFEETIEAWVSDSITRLQVRFATSAAHKYREETRRRLTQDSLGGILQITDFEILATHLGPRPSRLTFLIKDFQNVGCVGSGGFGCPRALNDLPEIIELLDRLQILRSQGRSKAHQSLITGKDAEDRDLQFGSQSETQYSSPDNRSRPASQEIFATQVSRSQLVKSSDLHAWSSKNTSDHGESNDSPSLDPIMKSSLDSATRSMELLSCTTTAEVIANTNAANSTSHLRTSGSPSRKNPGMVDNEKKRPDRASELLQLLPNNRAPKLNKRPKMHTTPANLEDDHRGSASHIVNPESDDHGGKAQTTPARDVATTEEPVPLVESKTVVAPCIEVINREAEVLHNTKPILELEAVPLPRSLRIRSREVKISKHQKALLDHSNSWIPANPGQTNPIGNIPVAILQSISDQIEGSLRRLPQQNIQPSSRAESLTRTSSSILDSDTSQDSDEIPISSGQWPASPPREQKYEEIPSDSSEEAPSRADQIEKAEEERIPAQKPRRQNITREQTSRAKYGNDKFDTRSATSSAQPPINVTSEKPIPAGAALSQETSYLDQHASEAECNHLAPSTTPNHTELNDYSSQDGIADEPSKRSGELSNTITLINTNAIIDSPENIRSPISSGIEIGTMQLSKQSKKNLDCDDVPQPTYQSTASNEPVLQVEATPYVNGHILKSTYIDRSECLSPSRKTDGLPRNRTHFDESDEMPLSQAIIEISSAQISSSKSTEDVLAALSSSEIAIKVSASAESGPADLRAQEVADGRNSCIAYGNQHDTINIEDTFISATAPPEISSGDYGTENPPITAKGDAHTTKRKFLELQSPSLETAKRQKQVEEFTSKFTADPQTMVDPSILGHKYRQDFYNSRKSFIDSRTNEAPKSPTVVSQRSKPGSPAKSKFYEGLLGGKVEIEAPLHHTLRKQIPAPDPEDDDMGEIILPSVDEEGGLRHLAAKTVGPSNVTLDMPESQITDHAQAQVTEHDAFTRNIGSSIKLPIFDQFKAAYRGYAAPSSQFLAICRKIERLIKDGHMLHQYLWDDFIIRHKTEYPTYLVSCAEKAEDPLPYEQFYQKNIVKPLFTKGIVTPDNIHQAFLSSQQVVHMNDQRSKQQRENISGTDNILRRNIRENSNSSSPNVTAGITIDLTSDEEITRSAEKQTLMNSLSRRKSLRSLPWIKTTDMCQVEVTPTKKGFSRTSSSSHISHSPLLLAPLPNSKPLKTSYPGGSSSPKKVVAFEADQPPDISTRAETMMSHHSGMERDSYTSGNKSNNSPKLRQSKPMHGSKPVGISQAQKQDEASHNNDVGSNNDDYRLRPPLAREKRKEIRKSHLSTPHNTQPSFKLPPRFSPPQEKTSSSSSNRSKDKAQSEARKEVPRGKIGDNNNKNNNNPLATFVKAYAAIRPGMQNSYARDRDNAEVEGAKTKANPKAGDGSKNDEFVERGGGGEDEGKNESGEEMKQQWQQRQKIDVVNWRL